MENKLQKFVSREIKFRIWAKDPCSNQSEHKMIYLPKWTIFDGQDLVFRTDLETFWIDSSASSEDAVLMQYTGLKDRNGREIYEGDLFQSKECYYEDCRTEKPELKWRDYYFKVEFKNGGFCGTRLDQNHSFRLTGDRNDEIVGNIYQNPISAGL